jgi:hypothetical protein
LISPDIASVYSIKTTTTIRNRRKHILLVLRPVLLWHQPLALACLLPGLTLGPGALAFRLQLVIACAQLGDGLFREELLECPLLNVLRLVFLQLCDERNGALQDGSLVLLAARDNLRQLVDALVDGLAATPLNC